MLIKQIIKFQLRGLGPMAVHVLLYRGGQYRGTFLVPLSIPSLLFKNCTVFGTVDTFFALLSSLLGTICVMEFK